MFEYIRAFNNRFAVTAASNGELKTLDAAALPAGEAMRIGFHSVNGPDAIEHIVDFQRPPVVEVALGVQFAHPVVTLDVLSALVVRWREEYPFNEPQEPLPRVVETFDRPIGGPTLELRLGASWPRTWLLSADQSRLIQLQPDRVIVNWRRVEEGDEYPRYATLRPWLLTVLREVLAVATEYGGPPAPIDAVEVTYVNELASPQTVEVGSHPALERMVLPVGAVDGTFLPDPEDTGYAARFRIDEGDGPVGRLVVRTDIGFRNRDGAPIYLMNLTANIVRPARDAQGVPAALDLARRWVVKGFLDLTTKEMHEKWDA